MVRLKEILLFVLLLCATGLQAAVLKGRVVDAQSGEALIGATVRVVQAERSATTDLEGYFEINGLGQRNYTLTVSYISYKKVTMTVNPARLDSVLVIPMELFETALGTATVTATAKRNTENAVVAVQRNSLVVQSGVSAQQIARTQDKDASEVIRRVPGISIIDEKFVMVRGLSQRYNNVWINGSAVPSTEADSRAFSFDIIPSGQVDNMQIIKSPAPQYPADFSGGFILIDTKDVPNENTASISLSGSVNGRTHFRTFLSPKGSGTDFLGFDNGFRSLRGGMGAQLATLPGSENIDLLANGLNNDWKLSRFSPVGDFSLSANLNRSRELEGGGVFALLGALNYSNSYKTYSPMENSLFGAYDVTHDRSNYLRHSTDRQYNHNVRLGAMLNLTFVPGKGAGRYEWKNIFNQLGTSRYTFRTGFNAQSNREESAEYYYSSRTTYNTQFTSKYAWAQSRLDWNVGYAYANRNLPDRRRYRRDNALNSDSLSIPTGNDISREFTRLDEHIASASVNYRYAWEGLNVNPEILAGAYGEYRTRKYRTRSFIYGWHPGTNTLPHGFQYMDIPTQLMLDGNYGEDGLYLKDDTRMTNDYKGNQLIASGYVAVNLPLGALNIYTGVRFEHYRMELIRNTRDDVESPLSRFYDGDDFFPSINMTYKLALDHQLRLAYGRSVNRAEFREVSPSVFYDFDLASSVQGNVDLRSCYVDNLDLRYEWYPSRGDQITLAGFYKNFSDPIEWTYTVAGGTELIYSYQNADRAYCFGLELDIRKNLAFMGLKDFTLVFNGSLIKSKVEFGKDVVNQEDRPMQGQSPYLVNLGIFYSHKDWNASLLYNRIGKRLIGVGRNLGTTGDQTVKVPDSYEMPRNSLDLNVSKDFGKWNVKVGAKDILGEKVNFKQFETVTRSDGSISEIEEVTRSYRPGRSFSVSVAYNF